MLNNIKLVYKDYTYKTIDNLKARIKQINFRDITILGDTNKSIAEFILKDYLPSQIGLMTSDDYENIYNSCEDNMDEIISNNGVIYEWIADEIISDKYNLISLLVLEDINLQTPEQGFDMIYYNPKNNDIYLFEAKSSEQKMTKSNYVKLVNNGLNSLFCRTNVRSNAKLSRSKKYIRSLEISPEDKIKTLEVMKEVVGNRRNLLNIIDNESININIVTINSRLDGFDLSDDQNIAYQKELVEVISTTYKCNSNCKLKKRNKTYCEEVLSKQTILNLLTVQVMEPISIVSIYNELKIIIEMEGLLDE